MARQLLTRGFQATQSQGRRNSGMAGGAVKKLRAMETYKKKQKIVINNT